MSINPGEVQSAILLVDLLLEVLGTERMYPVSVTLVEVGSRVTAQANNRHPIKCLREPCPPRPVVIAEPDVRIQRRWMLCNQRCEGATEWLDIGFPEPNVRIELHPNLNGVPTAIVPHNLCG